MLTTLLSLKPISGLATCILTAPSFQSHNNLQLLALLIALKVFLTCAVMFFAMLVIVVSLACALYAIVTKLSSNDPTERTVI